jgi:hypothetical protein
VKVLASGLDVGLLARPTAKERLTLHLGWERPERRNLPSQEKSVGNLHHCQTKADALEVDTDLPTTRDRIEGEAVGVGVGHVKVDRIRASISGKGRLTLGPVAKGQALRRAVQVAAEDRPEHAASNDKVLATSLEIKPPCRRLFIRAKCVEKALTLCLGPIQESSPDMNLIATQRQGLRHHSGPPPRIAPG